MDTKTEEKWLEQAQGVCPAVHPYPEDAGCLCKRIAAALAAAYEAGVGSVEAIRCLAHRAVPPPAGNECGVCEYERGKVEERRACWEIADSNGSESGCGCAEDIAARGPMGEEE